MQIPDDPGYYQAKERGFDATSADIVVFADGDCWPDSDWLQLLVAPFAEEREPVSVAGRTVFLRQQRRVSPPRVRSAALQRRRGIYRGNCEVAGMKLVQQGVPVRFVPAARTTHRFPGSARELLALRLLRVARCGEDTVLARHLQRRALPKSARWLMELGPASPALVPGTRFACSLAALNHQDLPKVAKRAAVVGLIAGQSLLDAAGAVKGMMPKREPARAAHKTTTLSYHGDGDRLSPQ